MNKIIYGAVERYEFFVRYRMSFFKNFDILFEKSTFRQPHLMSKDKVEIYDVYFL